MKLQDLKILKVKIETTIDTDTLPVTEVRGFHCLDGLNRVYLGFLLIPLNLATSTG